MLNKLMTSESLVKLAVNAAQMTLGFNAKIKWVDAKYNEDTISDLYGTYSPHLFRIHAVLKPDTSKMIADRSHFKKTCFQRTLLAR